MLTCYTPLKTNSTHVTQTLHEYIIDHSLCFPMIIGNGTLQKCMTVTYQRTLEN